MKKPQNKIEGVIFSRGKIMTKNLVPGSNVYGERLFRIKGKEYRDWKPFRSKIGAGLKNGLKELPVKENNIVLYLGVAEGTTASHLSDIIGKNGALFGVDLSERTMTKFVELCEERTNMLPILESASRPDKYEEFLKGIEVDVLIQDISQKNQAEIFNKNAKMFLKKGKKGLIAIKAKSVSSTKDVDKIYDEQKKELEKEFNIIQCINLKPYEKSHLLCLCEKK